MVLFEVRLLIAVPDYGVGEASALDPILDLLSHDSEIVVLDTAEKLMRVVPAADGDG